MSDLALVEQQNAAITAFGSVQGFESTLRMAEMMSNSKMVPELYQGPANVGNVMIAFEMSQRIGASVMAVMQSMHVINGRPSWSSSFIIAALNSCGRFSPLRFRLTDLGPKKVTKESGWIDKKTGERKTKTVTVDLPSNMEFVAWCYDKATGEVLEGPAVTYDMAVQEGWWTKFDSKWQTMPELMGRYRAAAFFGRLYAPDILNGMHTQDEVEDFAPTREVKQVREVAPTRAATPREAKGADSKPKAPEEPQLTAVITEITAAGDKATLLSLYRKAHKAFEHDEAAQDLLFEAKESRKIEIEAAATPAPVDPEPASEQKPEPTQEAAPKKEDWK